jgi:hypothetical protein
MKRAANPTKTSQPYIRSYEKGGMVVDPERLQIAGGGNTINEANVKGAAGGGRVGYRFAAGPNADVTAGVSGSMSRVKVNTPEGVRHYADKRLTGVDLTYRKGNTSVGVGVSKGPTPDTPQGGKRLSLTYRKEF